MQTVTNSRSEGGSTPFCCWWLGLGNMIGVTLFAAVVLFLSQRAAAGPPFFTDDPEPVEKGHGEFYIASQNAWTRDGWSGTLPHFEFNYGPVQDVQLHLIAPLVFDRRDDTQLMHYGYGDTELGIKWRPIHENALFDGSPQIGTFPIFELPTGNENRGLGNGRAQFFLPLWLQRSWGGENRKWTTYGGGGYWINPGEGNRDYWFTGVVLQKQVADHLTLGGEMFHTTPSADGGSNRTGFNLGGAYDFSEHWHLLFSAGRDFQGLNQLTTYLGIQLTF